MLLTSLPLTAPGVVWALMLYPKGSMSGSKEAMQGSKHQTEDRAGRRGQTGCKETR